jgi:hypothetical protein
LIPFSDRSDEVVNFPEQDDWVRRFSQRKQAKTNGIGALKAVAHKLARVCYDVLRDQVPFAVSKAFACRPGTQGGWGSELQLGFVDKADFHRAFSLKRTQPKSL